MTFKCHLPLEWSFINLKKFSVGQEAENDFKVTIGNLNNPFFDFIQIAFWASQET